MHQEKIPFQKKRNFLRQMNGQVSKLHLLMDNPLYPKIEDN